MRRASPKSESFGTPVAVSRTLAGFRSRWRTPCWCGVVHGPSQEFDQLNRRLLREGHAAHFLSQGSAFDVLQGEIGEPLVVAHFVDLDDIGML